MSYKLAFTKAFIKEFNRLPKNEKERIFEAIKKLSEFPYNGTKLRGKLEGLWRWRVGNYRIIYLIDEKEKTIVFLDVGPRKTIYE